MTVSPIYYKSHIPKFHYDTPPLSFTREREKGEMLDCLVFHRGEWVWVSKHVAFLCAWDRMHHCDQRSQVWYQRRMHMLTASQLATALDKNPYQTRDELIRHYAGVNIGNANKFTGNEATRHGEKYEDEAVALYEKRYRTKVLLFGLMPFPQHYGFLGGSVDGVTCDGTLVEVKCPYRRVIKDFIPSHYIPQVESMMDGFGLSQTHFIEYIPESQWRVSVFKVHELPRNTDFLSKNLRKLSDFWSCVMKCRKEADRHCFLPPTVHVQKRKRKRTEMPCRIQIPPV